MKCLLKISLLCCSLFVAFPSFGQIRITASGDNISSISYGQYKAGASAGEQLFLRTLKNDLKNSGYFAEGLSGSEYILAGGSTLQGTGFSARIQVFKANRSVYGRGYPASAKNAASVAHRVADDILKALKGVQGMSSTRIALIGTQTGKKELYICDPDGSNLQRITNFGKTVMSPRWGPYGQKLTFTAWLKQFPDVYLFNLQKGGNAQKICSYPGLNAGGAISPTGNELAVILSKDGKPELYVKHLSSGKLTRITYTPNSAKSTPCWSPDGRQIAFVSGHAGQPSVYTISRQAGAKPRKLVSRLGETVSPTWNTAGKIAYAAKVGRNYQIEVFDPVSRQTSVVSPSDASYEDPSWAPDGRHIVCTRSLNYRSSIYILDTASRSPKLRSLIEGNGDWYTPSWSPR